METRNTETSKGWDAREHFVREVVFRLNRVGLCNDQNQKAWLEILQDYLDLVCVYFQDKVKNYQTRLDSVSDLIYATKKKKKGMIVSLTSAEISINKQQAYKDLREIFRDMHISAYNEGAYMPISHKKDPGRAIAGYYEKKKNGKDV